MLVKKKIFVPEKRIPFFYVNRFCPIKTIKIKRLYKKLKSLIKMQTEKLHETVCSRLKRPETAAASGPLKFIFTD